MTRFKLTYLVLGFIILFACRNESPFVDKSVVDAIRESQQDPDIENIAFIFRNNVFYLDNLIGEIRQVTNTGSEKTHVALSYDLTKIAFYENQSAILVIQTSNGKVLQRYDGYFNVKTLGWSGNGKTLFIQDGNEIKIIGSNIRIPEPELTNNEQMRYSSLSRNGHWVYIRERYSDTTGYLQKLVILNSSGSETEFDKDSGNTLDMNYVHFSPSGRQFIVGYSTGSSQELRRLDYYSDFSGVPYKKGVDSTVRYFQPIHDESIAYVTCAYNTNGIDYWLSSIRIEPEGDVRNDLQSDTITSKEPNLYLDWKN